MRGLPVAGSEVNSRRALAIRQYGRGSAFFWKNKIITKPVRIPASAGARVVG